MIDLSQETLLPILDVKQFFPVSKPTLRRWTASGKLETIRMGSRVFTSREALQRMARHGPQQPHQPPLSLTRRQKQRQAHLKKVHEELAELMGPDD